MSRRLQHDLSTGRCVSGFQFISNNVAYFGKTTQRNHPDCLLCLCHSAHCMTEQWPLTQDSYNQCVPSFGGFHGNGWDGISGDYFIRKS